jgi:hypothetical protein
VSYRRGGPTGVNHQIVLVEDLEQPPFAAVYRVTLAQGRGGHRAAVATVSEQHARLLERLAYDRDPVRKTSDLEAQAHARRGVGQARRPRQVARLGIVGVEAATGEHGHAAHERGALASAQQQHLEAESTIGARSIVEHHDSGRVVDRHRVGVEAGRTRRGQRKPRW